MTTYIALFRGINVGRNRSLPMRSLKTILEQLGCRQVKTYIQSGNVVFQHTELDRTRFAGQAKRRGRCGYEAVGVAVGQDVHLKGGAQV